MQVLGFTSDEQDTIFRILASGEILLDALQISFHGVLIRNLILWK